MSNRFIKINVILIFFFGQTHSRFFMSRKPLKLFVKRKQVCFFGTFSIKIKNLLAIVVKEFQVCFVRLFLMISTHSEGKKKQYIRAKIQKTKYQNQVIEMVSLSPHERSKKVVETLKHTDYLDIS